MKKRVFISSTFVDLEPYREAVRKLVRRQGAEDVAMEYFGARDDRPKQECVRIVTHECDYFVGIYAHRYGFVPPGDAVSVTEAEYDAATAAGLPRLIYIVKDSAPWPEQYQEKGEGETKLKALKKRVSELIRDTFSNPDDLAGKVAADLSREFSQDPVPRHLGALRLEPPIGDFVGREGHIAELEGKLGSGSILLTALRGMGGVGKTQLARKLASRIQRDFDLTLELNLQGVSAALALSPREVLTRLINAVIREGSELPDDMAKLSAVWQDCLRRRRVLLLLDNAADAAQVLPVLPKSAGHQVIITSRTKFHLPGLHKVEMDSLDPNESRRMLREICRHLTEAEADAVAKECAYLPLALRLAGSFLTNREDLPVSSYLADLRSRRLALLSQAAAESGELGITATLGLSYDSAPPEFQSKWRMLGVFPEGFDVAAAAAVWGESGDAYSCLAEIKRQSLLDWNRDANRYALHDLLRDFARSKLTTEESNAAHLRFARHFQRLLAKWDDEAFPLGGAIARDVLNSFQRELGNISTAWEWCAQQAAAIPEAAAILAGFSDNTGELLAAFSSPSQRVALYEKSLAADLTAGNPRAALRARFGLARAHYDRGDDSGSAAAVRLLVAVIQDAGKLGETETLANARMFSGRLFRREGKTEQALAEHRQAVAEARILANPIFLTKTLSQLARTQADCNSLSEAEAANQEARAIAQKGGYRQYLTGCASTEARILNLRAAAENKAGNGERQRELLNQSIAIAERVVEESRHVGSIKLLNIAIFSLGRTLRFRNVGDDLVRALGCFEESLKLNQQLGNIRGEAGAYLDIGDIQRIIGRETDAIESLEAALDLQREAGNILGQAQTLESLVKLLLKRDPVRARELAAQCRELYRSPNLRNYKWQLSKFEEWLRKHS